MGSRLSRTLAIFRLAISYWGDSRRITRARRSLSEGEARRQEDLILSQGAIRFRRTALRLGGLIIKVGQFLSARTDILPLAFTRELAGLQDQVPEAPWVEVKRLMEEEWGRSLEGIFQRIETHPVAAASLGQVHRAWLLTGEEVAVKVQRPGIQRLAEIDLSALGVIMRVVERFTRVGRRINASRLFEEFRGLVSHELDYRQEVEYLSRFKSHFQDDKDVVVPTAWAEMTCERVFVMEYLTGVKLTDTDGLRAQGLLPEALANILIRAYLKQIAVDGLVQIDPHAGNFFADRQGRVIFLDFGMMAELPAQDLGSVANLIQGILTKDADVVLVAVDALGFVRPDASRRLLKRAIIFLLDRLSGVPLEAGPELDRAVAEFQDFLYQEPLEFPARYMFLGRAIGMLFGLVSTLDPELDWMTLLQKEALPLLKARQRQAAPQWVESVGRVASAIFGKDVGVATEAAVGLGWQEILKTIAIPGQMRQVLSTIQSGDLATTPELTSVLRRLDRLVNLNQAQLQLAWAFILGVGAIGLHRVWPGYTWVSWVVAVLAGVMALRSWRSARRGRRRTRLH